MLVSQSWALMWVFSVMYLNEIVDFFTCGICFMNNALWLFLNIEIDIDVYIVIWSRYWGMPGSYARIFVGLFIRGTANTS